MSAIILSSHTPSGLPNAFGGYDETPEIMAGLLKVLYMRSKYSSVPVLWICTSSLFSLRRSLQ